jgi:hypothetical protein
MISMGVIKLNVQYLDKNHDEFFMVYKNLRVPMLSMECLKKLWLIPQGFPFQQVEAPNQDLSTAPCSNETGK